MKYLNVIGLLGAALLALPVESFAQQYGYSAKDINLRAGPSRDYPVVAVVPAGVSLRVEGCLTDYRWCDVTSGPDRGWVYAGNITYTYHGSRVPLINYGAVLGIGILAFSVGDYWDNHYQARPWYPQRQQWVNRSIPGSRSRNDGIRPELTTPQFRPQRHAPPFAAPRVPQPPPHAGQQAPLHRPGADNPRQPQSRPAFAVPPGAPQQRGPAAQRPEQAHPRRQPWENAGGGKN